MNLNEKIFREYDIRGVADRDLPDNLVLAIARSIGTLAKQRGTKTFTVGRDCRVSSVRIHDAMIQGLLESGIDVIDVGLVPTPLLYFSIHSLNTDGGVMITGSHNPGDHNGLKVCIGPSTIHGGDIQTIKQMTLDENWTSGQGTLSKVAIVDDYINYVSAQIKEPLGITVVIDSGNGMAGMVAPQLLRKIGCTVVDLYSELDGTFPNHHPDPTVVENLVELRKAVKASNAVVGIGFDGDADRIGVVDKNLEVIFGDELLMLYSREVLKTHPGAVIISEVKASNRLFQDIKSHGGRPILWKTGHSLIKAKMKEENALLAGEMSGHMFFKDRYFGFDDAIYAAVRLVEILAKYDATAKELLSDIPLSYSTPEIRVNCSDDIKFDIVEKAKAAFLAMGQIVNGIDGARVEFGTGWGLVRASNTQPVLVYRFEADTPEELTLIQETVENTVNTLLIASS